MFNKGHLDWHWVDDIPTLLKVVTETEPSKDQPSKDKLEKDVTITLRIPPRIAKDLKIKAATADKTQREFILEGLKLMGVDVKDEDIADRRKS